MYLFGLGYLALNHNRSGTFEAIWIIFYLIQIFKKKEKKKELKRQF
jgi:hypothetical protein